MGFLQIRNNPDCIPRLELALGEVAGAVGNADRSGDAFERMAFRATHADALHQAGRRSEAETRFREAEQMQQERQPAYPLLYSVQGFQYCDLLLAVPERAAWQICLESRLQAAGRGKVQSATASSNALAGSGAPPAKAGTPNEICRAVSQRAAQTLKWVTGNLGLLDEALDHLTLGRAALYAAILERSAAVSAGPAAATPNAPSVAGSSNACFPADAAAGGASPTPALQTARRELDAAVDGLRRAGTQHMIPHGLLTRAWLRFLTGPLTGPDSAQEDLDEAWEIAERGPMRLFLADILLHRARLFGARQKEKGERQKAASAYPWESPAADLAAAEKLIHSCGYHRRDAELADAQRALLGS